MRHWRRWTATIHPPVQGGNRICALFFSDIGDTPSRTGRKRNLYVASHSCGRYTLPYREETFQMSRRMSARLIHPPVQGGNTDYAPHSPEEADTPSRTGRKRSMFMRVCGSLNTALCILHNNCIIRYFVGNLSYLICHFFGHR